MAEYLKHVFIALDQVVTTLLGGWPDETLSSYAYRLEQNGRVFGLLFRPMLDALFFWTPLHCYESWQAEREHYQLPPDLR